MDLHDLVMTAVRASVIYVFLLVVLRVLGKRTVGNSTAFDFMVALILGAVSVVFILLRLLTETSNVSFGLFLGLAAAVAVTYGSYQAMQEAGMSVDDMKRGLGGGGGPGEPPQGPGGAPPAP